MSGKQRIKKNLEITRKKKCEVCGKLPPSDPAHIHSRGAGGSDDLSNLMALCRKHHIEQHQIGLHSFTLKYNLPLDLSGIYPKRLL